LDGEYAAARASGDIRNTAGFGQSFGQTGSAGFGQTYGQTNTTGFGQSFGQTGSAGFGQTYGQTNTTGFGQASYNHAPAVDNITHHDQAYNSGYAPVGNNAHMPSARDYNH